jgi:hypothetical protein
MGAWQVILWSGFLAGTLDLTYAIVVYGFLGAKPIRILQGIASGLLGASSFQGGWETAVLGTALHFLIALGAAAVYYALSRKIALLTKRYMVSGLIYGVAVYLFMNFIVLPLSAVHRGHFTLTSVIIAVIPLMFCIGLPISLIVHRYRPYAHGAS